MYRKKHKQTVEAKAESNTPCKITKFTDHASEENVVWINQGTQIDEASEMNIDFSYEKVDGNQATLCLNTQELDAVKVYECVTVCGLVLFGDNKPQDVPTKPGLTKLEGCFVDEHGSIPLTLWNNDIGIVENDQYYIIENIRLRQYLGQKYLSSTSGTKFKKMTENTPRLAPEAIQEASSQFFLKEVVCESIQSVNTFLFYSCVRCSKRVQFCQAGMLKCGHCGAHFLTKNSQKQTTARVSLKQNDEVFWYTLFQPALQAMVTKYNENNGTHEVLEQID